MSFQTDLVVEQTVCDDVEEEVCADAPVEVCEEVDVPVASVVPEQVWTPCLAAGSTRANGK